MKVKNSKHSNVRGVTLLLISFFFFFLTWTFYSRHLILTIRLGKGKIFLNAAKQYLRSELTQFKGMGGFCRCIRRSKLAIFFFFIPASIIVCKNPPPPRPIYSFCSQSQASSFERRLKLFLNKKIKDGKKSYFIYFLFLNETKRKQRGCDKCTLA